MWGYKPASACFLPLLPSVSSVQRGKKMDFFINPKIKKLLPLTSIASNKTQPCILKVGVWNYSGNN